MSLMSPWQPEREYWRVSSHQTITPASNRLHCDEIVVRTTDVVFHSFNKVPWRRRIRQNFARDRCPLSHLMPHTLQRYDIITSSRHLSDINVSTTIISPRNKPTEKMSTRNMSYFCGDHEKRLESRKRCTTNLTISYREWGVLDRRNNGRQKYWATNSPSNVRTLRDWFKFVRTLSLLPFSVYFMTQFLSLLLHSFSQSHQSAMLWLPLQKIFLEYKFRWTSYLWIYYQPYNNYDSRLKVISTLCFSSMR